MDGHRFIETNKQDIWNSTLHVSQSLRTKKRDDLLGVKPIYEDFSQNDHLDFYKQGLVMSKNVDKIVPFKHSQKYFSI